jgi:hypothetical protein
MVGWKILAPLRTTKACSPNWDLAKLSFVQVLNFDAGRQSSNLARELCYIFIMTSFGLIPGTGIIFVLLFLLGLYSSKG